MSGEVGAAPGPVQPVGPALPGWRPPRPLEPVALAGRWVRLESLAPEHAAPLYAATCGAGRERQWTYLAEEMPESEAAFAAYLRARLAQPMLSLAMVPRDGAGASGMAAWMREDTANGVVEVGSIVLGERLQRTAAATEAQWLMARHVFAQGFRRYEWKCDALNAPSRRAAERLGFGFEGVFRDHVVYKGRSRDTAWYAVTAQDWPRLAPAYAAWLDPANFDEQGCQRTRLSCRDLRTVPTTEERAW